MKSFAGIMSLVVLGVLVALNGPVWSDENGKENEDEAKETVEMAASARVSIYQAIKIALDKVAIKVVEAELEKKHGKVVWEVEVVTPDNKVLEIHIDADNGSVIDVEEKKD